MNQTIKQAVIGLGIVGAMALTGCGGSGGGASGDTTPPVITLKGEERVSFEEWQVAYEELGATAVDNQDGNLSVSINGGVGDEPNVYTITYDAYDNAGNRGFAQRFVTVTSAPEDTNKTRIDVLALYSNGADTLYAGDAQTRITHLMEVTNHVFNASRTGAEFVLVGLQKHESISDTEILRVELNKARVNSDIQGIRNSKKADVVYVFHPYVAWDPACGLAFTGGSLSGNDYAYGAVGVDCPTDTLPHELGHTLGNTHSHVQNVTEGFVGVAPYATGHLVENNFGTIMTYAFNYGAERKYIFSSPDLTCNGEPCGIEAGEVGEADASRTIRETKQAVSNFRLGGGETPPTSVYDQSVDVSIPTSRGVVGTIEVVANGIYGYYFVYDSLNFGNTTRDGYFRVNSAGEVSITQNGIDYLNADTTITELSYIVRANSDTALYNFTVTLKIAR